MAFDEKGLLTPANMVSMTTAEFEGAKRLFPGLDVYTVRCYQEESPTYFITEYDLAYWYNWFTQTRPNRFGKRFRKGFVQLDYNLE